MTLIHNNAKSLSEKKKSIFSRAFALNDSSKGFPSGTCKQEDPQPVVFLSWKLWADKGKIMEVKQTIPQLFQAYFLHVMPVKFLVKLKGFIWIWIWASTEHLISS